MKEVPVNALLGSERVMTSDVAGTTRDAVEIDFSIKYRDEYRPAVLVDTAGLRKTAKVDDLVEYFKNLCPDEQILGYMTAPWASTMPTEKNLLFFEESFRFLKEAKDAFYGG